MTRTREEAIRLGIKVRPIIPSMKRRAVWNDYWKPGRYGITIHIYQYEDGSCERCSFLGDIVGDCHAPRFMSSQQGSSSKLTSDALADETRPAERIPNPAFPHIQLSEVGMFVQYKINQIGKYERYKDVVVRSACIMPTHIHLTLEILHALPKETLKNGKVRQYTLGHMIGMFKSGCTSLYKRWLNGEFLQYEIGSPEWYAALENKPTTYTTVAHGKQFLPSTNAPSLWEDGYNDRILRDEYQYHNWLEYVDLNAYYWKLRIDYPQLFEHRLHLTIAGSDYSAYGCMFLLKRPERVQVFCHRLARRGQLTDEEWQKATASWNTIQAFEKNAREKRLGRFDKDWYRTTDPDATTAIDYTRTEAFRKQKAEILMKCERDDAVIVSPAVSAGEQEIFYSALELGYRCIKLVKDVIPEKGHPVSIDRDYCAHGQLLVLGPWEIKDTNNYASRFGDAESKYAKFHNLNEMAAELCKENLSMSIDRKTLERCR